MPDYFGWHEVDVLIRGASPEKLEAARQSALVLMSEAFRKQNENADPMDKKHLLLRVEIARVLKSQEEA